MCTDRSAHQRHSARSLCSLALPCYHITLSRCFPTPLPPPVSHLHPLSFPIPPVFLFFSVCSVEHVPLMLLLLFKWPCSLSDRPLHVLSLSQNSLSHGRVCLKSARKWKKKKVWIEEGRDVWSIYSHQIKRDRDLSTPQVPLPLFSFCVWPASSHGMSGVSSHASLRGQVKKNAAGAMPHWHTSFHTSTGGSS